MMSFTDEVRKLAEQGASLPSQTNGKPPERNGEPLSPPHPMSILNQLAEEVREIEFTRYTEGENPRAVDYRMYFVENIIHLAEEKGWGLSERNNVAYVYTGKLWLPVDEKDMRCFLGDAALRSSMPRRRAGDYKFRRDMFEQFLDVAPTVRPPRSQDVTLVNLQNGTFEITADARGLREYRRDDFLTHILPFEYRADFPVIS